ncbi:AAA family ATPase, partial [Escherichia coli]|nr:AAA family ATPase [Escherichia coli]
DDEGEAYVAQLILDAFKGEAPDIIAFDPLANLFDGEDENDNAQMMRFLRERLEGVRRRLSEKTAIVLVHHSNKASREYIETDPFSAIRGAGALRGYYTSAIVIYQPERDAPERHVFFDFRSDAAPEPVTVRYHNGRTLSVLDPLAEFED